MRRATLLIPVVATLVVLTGGAAGASEVTRDSYAAQVEPICKANTEANKKILKGVRAKVKAGRLTAAARQFEAAAKALRKTEAQLAAVPEPPADAAKLGKWLGYVKTEADLFQATADKLAANQKTAAQGMVVRLTHNANLANNQVLVFEFTYCRFEPSKFT
ncbi:MAG TPA: hypothetical protein VGC49_04355 [Solirubrobacterales bacterium]|jgi:hypothetical protein